MKLPVLALDEKLPYPDITCYPAAPKADCFCVRPKKRLRIVINEKIYRIKMYLFGGDLPCDPLYRLYLLPPSSWLPINVEKDG